MSQASTEGTGAQGSEGTGGQGTGAQGTEGQGTGAQGQGSGNGNGSGDQIDVASIQDPTLRAYVQKLQSGLTETRQEAARHRTTATSLQTQFDQFRQQHETAEQAATRQREEQATQSAQERQRLTALEQENRDLKVGSAVRAAADTAKAFNPARVAELIAGKVALAEDGTPVAASVTEQIDALRKSDPYLFKRTSSDAGRGNGNGEGSASSTDMNATIRAAAGRG